MAARVEGPSATIPAGTTQAAPLAVPLPIGESIVRRLDIIVPPGPSGLVGFYIAQSGAQLIPRTIGQFIVVDDKMLTFDMDGYPTGNKWTLVGYNIDIYNHIIRTIFHVDEVTKAAVPDLQIIPIG